MCQIGRRVRARDTLHAKLHPPRYIPVVASPIRAPVPAAAVVAITIDVVRRSESSLCGTVTAHDAADLAADQRIQRRLPLHLVHLEKNVGIYASKGGGNDLASALRDKASVPHQQVDRIPEFRGVGQEHG